MKVSKYLNYRETDTKVLPEYFIAIDFFFGRMTIEKEEKKKP